MVSTDKLTELTTQTENGKPAPDFDTFIWGWGGDPYDPSFLLSLLTTGEIGSSSDSFFSNPTYDRLYQKQSTQFDTAARKQTIQKMIAISQRDLPYLVLTQDPNLQAYRTDRIANVSPACPEDDTGDIICEQVGYAAAVDPDPGAGEDTASGGSSAGIIIAIAAMVVAGAGVLIVRSRRARASRWSGGRGRRGLDPEMRGSREQALAGGQGRRLRCSPSPSSSSSTSSCSG